MGTKKIRITGAQLSFSVGAIQENKSKILNTLKDHKSPFIDQKQLFAKRLA